MGFNEAQQRAIEHYRGPAFVLAGPGSGKTTVITHRIKNLIEKYQVPPSRILVITFTKMAALEMKERFLRLTQNNYSAVSFGTFHAIYFTILKHAYNYSADNIIRQSQQIEYINSIIDNYELEIDDKSDFVNKILAEISYIKGCRINVSEYESKNCPEKVFQDILKKYNEMLGRKRYIDFDDMMVYCYELFKKRKDILNAWQDKYKYILIDEFQDISDIQFLVIRQIAQREENLFIVGDDDQSIYGFRGAKPEIMLGFQKIYKNAVRIDMNINYRSTSNIVNAAKSVIDANKSRFYKDIKTVNEEGDKVVTGIFDNTELENQYISEQIKKYVNNGLKYSDMAVLARTNSQAGLLIQNFIENGIPFSVKEKVQNVYEHWVAKDVMAYIRISKGSADRKLYLRIINKPLRYVSRMAFSTPLVDLNSVAQYYVDKVWMRDRIIRFKEDLEMIKNMCPFAAVNYIRKGIGYDEYLKEYTKEHHLNYEELDQILSEVTLSAKIAGTYEQWMENIDEYTKRLVENVDKKEKNKESEGVNICTMHGSKGLEYEVVFVIDVVEGISPYKKAVLDDEIEEERRMFYVAMTRAKKYLHLCMAKERYNKKMTRSRFLEEINSAYTIIEERKSE